MAMELETLEVIIEANLAKLEAQMAKIMPTINKVMGNVEKVTGQSMAKTEKNLTVDSDKILTGFEKLTKQIEKQTQAIEATTKKSGENVGKNLSTGFKKARSVVGKDIDGIVDDINAKMGQAKAQQEKLAYLRTQRQSSSSKGDTKNTIRYDEQIANAQAKMSKYQSTAKQMADSIKEEFESVTPSLAKISETVKQNEIQAKSLLGNIRNLRKEYASQKIPVGNFTDGFNSSKESPASSKTLIEINKQNAKVDKLFAQNEKLQQTYEATEERAKKLKSAMSGLNTELGESSMQTGKAADGMKKIGNNTEKSRGFFSRFGGLFNRTSNNISHGTRRMNSGMGLFSHRLGQMVRQVFVFSVIYKGLQLVSRGLMDSLKTNDQFNSSLNQIKVNLMTAFYPIYTAILPAINALASSLAHITGVMASFIATMFGTTFSAAKKGAQGLYENIQAMNGTGAAADKNKEKIKKMQRALMGFDEINRIGLSDEEEKEDEKDKGLNFNTPSFAEPAWANKVKGILADFFKPFQDSWNKQGAKVMKAWKYALGEVNGAVKSVGKSFMEVWTNGTGERFISNIFILLTDVLNIVGDIARDFKNAWNDDGRGTNLIQKIFDMLNSVLELIQKVAKAFREAWNDNGIGQSIIANILDIFTDIFDVIGKIADRLSEAWESNNVGKEAFSIILGIVNDILGHIKGMSEATVEWADNLDFSPLLNSIKGLLENIRPLTDNIGGGLEWLYTNVLLPLASFTIEDLIPNFLDALGAAIGVLNDVIDALKPLGKWLWDEFLQPLAKWTGGVIVSALKGLTKSLEGISGWIKENQKVVEGIAIVLGSFAFAWGLATLAVGAWNVVAGIGAGITTALAGAVAFLLSPFGLVVAAIAGVIAIGVLLWKNWEEITEFAGKAWDATTEVVGNAVNATGKWVGDKWDDITKKTSETWDGIKKGTSEKWNNVKDSISTTVDTAKSNVAKNWGQMKTDASTRFDEIKRATTDKWTSVKDSVTDLAGKAKNGAEGAWKTMSEKVGGFTDVIKTNTGKAFGEVVGWAEGLGKKIGAGLKGGFEAVKNGAKELGRGVLEFPMKAVNGVINGVSWVLGLVGAESAASKMAEYKFAYANGTNNHPGGRALVNDGQGSNFREAFRLPNGKTGLFPNQRNMVVDLPKGSQVLSGARTATMMAGMPAYANGIGNWFSNKWEQAKEFAGNVWEYASNPSKLLDIGISRAVSLAGAFDPALSMAQGVIGTASEGAMDMIKQAFKDNEPDAGDGGGQYAPRFPNPPFVMTSGMGARWGTTHNGIDFGAQWGTPIPAQNGGRVSAAGGGVAGFGKWVVVEVAKDLHAIYGHVSKVLTQTGANVSKGQIIANVGNEGQSTGPHVHYELRKGGLGGQAVDPNTYGSELTSGNPAGAGVERWRPYVLKGFAATQVPKTADRVERFMRQIQTESGGNPGVTQNGYVDQNTGGNEARGLMQIVPTTWNSIVSRYFGGQSLNPFNGYDSIKVAMKYIENYINPRYGYNKPGDYWRWIGRGYGYENGGMVSNEGHYRVAEGNKPEMIIPLTRPNRAMELIDQALDFMGMSADFGSLQMPEMFRNDSSQFDYSGPSHNDSNKFKGNSFGDISQNVAQAISMALAGSSNQGGQTIHITIEQDGDKMGEKTVKYINKQIDKTGNIPLNL